MGSSTTKTQFTFFDQMPAIGLPADFECCAGSGFPSKSVDGWIPDAKTFG